MTVDSGLVGEQPSEPTQGLWRPDALDRFQFTQGYLLYAAGVSVINNPETMYDIHGRDVFDEAKASEVLEHAKTIIWAGLSDVIRYSNPPMFRSSLDSAEHNFTKALPFMIEGLEEVVETESDRLYQLNPLLTAIRPLPVAQESAYKYVSRGRKGKLRVSAALGGFAAHELFGEDAGDQLFTDAKPPSNRTQ